MRVEWHAEIGTIASAWDELADRVGATPFMRPGWIESWWRAFGVGKLAIVAVQREGRLAGVLPLSAQGAVLRATANWHTPAFDPLAEDEEARRAIAQAMFSLRPLRVSLGFLTGERADLDVYASAAEAAGYRLIVRMLDHSCFVPIEGQWAARERRLRKGRLSDLRRCRRRLEERGRLALDVHDGQYRLDDLLEEGFHLEALGWRGEGGTAILSGENTRAFYTDVARWASERGWLRLNFLRLDGRPLAFHYVIADGASAFHLKSGYDPAYRKFAPGMLIIQDILAGAFADGSRRVHFLGSAEPYKLEWTDRTRDRFILQAFKHSPAGFVNWAAFAYARPLAKRLRALSHHR